MIITWDMADVSFIVNRCDPPEDGHLNLGKRVDRNSFKLLKKE